MVKQINEEQLKIVHETAKIPWTELQKFFAAGKAINIDPNLDLIEVAHKISKDEKSYIEPLMEKNLIAPVSDELAKEWFEKNKTLWAVVIAPWVLVQDKIEQG